MKENIVAGIYKITNIITDEFYIGSSKDIKLRWANHKCPSRWKLRPGMKLYQAFIKYGLNNFTFEIIEETTDLHNREQYYIEKLKPNYNNNWAQGQDIERYKETGKQCHKEYYEIHRDEVLTYNKAYYSKVCLYEGETLTLGALSSRFRQKGIPHPTLTAKSYLIENPV